MDAGSAAAFYAGTLLLRKTFETVAQRSVSSLFSRLHSRFQGQAQLQCLQKDIEARLQVLSLPVDICIQYVLNGNTALQGALELALRLINDVVSFQEELEAQSYNESIVKLSPAEAVSRLESFLRRLDAILPYLSVAMSSVSLLKIYNYVLSPSRLMEASYLVQSADTRQGVVISLQAKLHRYVTRLTLPRWQEKLISCNATFRRLYDSSPSGFKDYEIIITPEENDDDNTQTCISIPIRNLRALGASTLHVLGLGEHELEPVLLLDVAEPTAGLASESLSSMPAQVSSEKLVHYAIQCVHRSTNEANMTTVSNLEVPHFVQEGRGHNTSGSQTDGDDKNSFTSKISKLGVMEYVLKLCMLQFQEEKHHWLISDERIEMFFTDPRYLSEPCANVQRPQSGHKHSSLTSTPTAKKGTPGQPPVSRTPSGSVSVSSTLSVRRLSVTDMFGDLKLEGESIGKS